MREIEEDLRRIREEREQEEVQLRRLEAGGDEDDDLLARCEEFIKKRTRINATGYPEIIPIDEMPEGANINSFDMTEIANFYRYEGLEEEAEEAMRDGKMVSSAYFQAPTLGWTHMQTGTRCKCA